MKKRKLCHQFACSSLMLPEHRALLAQHRQKNARATCQDEQVPPAPADEQQLEQFQRLTEQSLSGQLPLKVTIREEGRYRSLTGVIVELQPGCGKILLQSGDRVITVPVARIVYLEAAELNY